MATPFEEPVYPVAGRMLCLRDLLAVFNDPTHMVDGISRFSDLHLKTGEAAFYRYDGDIVPLRDGTVMRPEVVELLVGALLTPEQFERLHAAPPVDIDASYAWPAGGLSFRVNAFRDRDGLAAVVRVLPRLIPALDSLGLPDPRIAQEICDLQQGLVIVAGNTGSGKSTTIASFLQHINARRNVRIITLEDPVEHVFGSRRALFSQRELGLHIPSFSAGLRSALREDPDIIFVGEMRDAETTALALTAAETGHLVFSTLHTKDAKGTASRIVDLFPPERTKEIASQLSLSLSYVISQKLVARRTGGRRLAVEVLKNTAGVAHLVRTGAWHQLYTQIETGHNDGMITLEHHLHALVRAGEISPEEARRNANDPQVVDRLLLPPP